MVWIIPYFGRYRVRHEKLVLAGGEVTHKLTKVKLENLEAWDKEHDAQGLRVSSDGSSSTSESHSGVVHLDAAKEGDLEKSVSGDYVISSIKHAHGHFRESGESCNTMSIECYKEHLEYFVASPEPSRSKH